MTATQNDSQRGQRLTAQRKELGLTQREMADRIGVNRNTIVAWEKGTLPQERHIAEAVEGYGLDEDFFFSSASEFERRLQAEVASIRADLDRLLNHFGASPDPREAAVEATRAALEAQERRQAD
jgi:transcriptional regulator with XRE-family HTH domain